LVQESNGTRLYLINYAHGATMNRRGGAQRSSTVDGLRVRVAGDFRSVQARQFDLDETKLQDVNTSGHAAEFTLPELKTFAMIDLTH
jgi:hypothetical protein